MTTTSYKLFIYSLLLLFTFSSESCIGANQLQNTESNLIGNQVRFLRVTSVVDGDTFWVDNGTAKGLKVRLIGIDAPETRKSFKKEIGYFGKESKAYLTKLIEGKRIRLVADVDSLDRFGRTLAYVYLEDGTFVNAELIINGYAVLMTIPPNVKFADYFSKLQREARNKRRGLWGK